MHARAPRPERRSGFEKTSNAHLSLMSISTREHGPATDSRNISLTRRVSRVNAAGRGVSTISGLNLKSIRATTKARIGCVHRP